MFDHRTRCTYGHRPQAPHSRMCVRDRPHIKNRRPPRIVSASTSRGDTTMRKFILIAGFVLASAAAQAGDRSLSLGGGETNYAPAPARAADTSKSAEAVEAPKYVERPAAVEPKSEEARSETARSETGRAAAGNTARMRQRPAGMQQRYAGRPQSAGAGGASARRAAMMQQRRRPAPHALRDPGAHHHARCIGTASTGKCQSKTRPSDSDPKGAFFVAQAGAGERLPANPLTASPSAPRC